MIFHFLRFGLEITIYNLMCLCYMLNSMKLLLSDDANNNVNLSTISLRHLKNFLKQFLTVFRSIVLNVYGKS